MEKCIFKASILMEKCINGVSFDGKSVEPFKYHIFYSCDFLPIIHH